MLHSNTEVWNKNGKPMVPRGFDHEKREIMMDPIHGWRTGHYPGALWLLHEATGDAFFRERATVWTELLEPNRNLDWHHDVGFIIMCSAHPLSGFVREGQRPRCPLRDRK